MTANVRVEGVSRSASSRSPGLFCGKLRSVPTPLGVPSAGLPTTLQGLWLLCERSGVPADICFLHLAKNLVRPLVPLRCSSVACSNNILVKAATVKPYLAANCALTSSSSNPKSLPSTSCSMNSSRVVCTSRRSGELIMPKRAKLLWTPDRGVRPGEPSCRGFFFRADSISWPSSPRISSRRCSDSWASGATTCVRPRRRTPSTFGSSSSSGSASFARDLDREDRLALGGLASSPCWTQSRGPCRFGRPRRWQRGHAHLSWKRPFKYSELCWGHRLQTLLPIGMSSASKHASVQLPPVQGLALRRWDPSSSSHRMAEASHCSVSVSDSDARSLAFWTAFVAPLLIHPNSCAPACWAPCVAVASWNFSAWKGLTTAYCLKCWPSSWQVAWRQRWKRSCPRTALRSPSSPRKESGSWVT